MPTMKQLAVVALIAAVCSVTVVLLLHLLGFGEHAPIAGGVSAGVAAAIAIGQQRPATPDEPGESPEG